jgi:hypothetical protein
MRLDEYLSLMLRVMRQDATYSSRRQAWVIAVSIARIFFLEQLAELPVEFRSVEDIIEEGARRGLWEIDSTTDILSLK